MSLHILDDRLTIDGPRTSFGIDTTNSHWLTVRPWIAEACEEADGWWTIDALERLVAERKAVLWVLAEDGEPTGAVVTTICDWDGRDVAEIIVAGGSGIIAGIDRHFWKIEDWARAHCASEIMFRGRRGWARALKPQGYEEIAVTLRKAL